MPRFIGFRLVTLMQITAMLSHALAQTPDPAYELLAKAFEALRSRDYDRAISSFTKAASLTPARADIRRNLAYTLLKTGDSEAAREQFGEAMRIDPADLHVALEYAFLCYEAREEPAARKAEARGIFLRVRDSAADAELRATAAQAFQNVDEPLKSGIARWKEALLKSPPSFSAHFELAQLAEQRDERDLAAAGYRAAFHLLPERKSVLLDLARVEKSRGNADGEIAALLAASRGGEPRAAELARERMTDRYPYVYEFRLALELDPKSDALHRELAYLLLRMSEENSGLREEAEREFGSVVTAEPDDYLAAAQLGLLYLADRRESEAMPLLNRVLAHADPATANRVRMALHRPLVLEERKAPEAVLDPRVLGERSYNAGFLRDALRYFTQAREANPVDASVALKLGWTNNMLHDDPAAIRWFDVARKSAEPAIATDAEKAYRNLRPEQQRFRTTVWMYPLFSSRWGDLFGYGQVKTEIRLKKLPLHPYVSLRFVGDVRGISLDYPPASLSENAFLVGAGVSTRSWHGGLGWFEAGSAFSYVAGRRWNDYRGGFSWGKTRGASLIAEHGGGFPETNADSVYLSHFNRNLINYSQNRLGYTMVSGPLRMQVFLTVNATLDVRRQYWANFAETGPGVRFHPPGLPSAMSVTFGGVHGVYLSNNRNPGRPNFNDFRVGVWYAFTR